MNDTRLLYLFTRTPLHVGAGSSVGAIDQPIIRERHTGFPVIPGSALKGVLADGYRSEDRKSRSEVGRHIFGHEKPDEENAKSGSISFGEAKLLAFPVRSAKGCFAWVTSRLALERWSRDSGVALRGITWPVAMELYGDKTTLAQDEKVVLEDYQFEWKAAFVQPEKLTLLLSGKDTIWSALGTTHLCLISDDMMAHFARNSCEVSQHVRIDDETGTAADQALFNQENVPAETLFYSSLHELRAGCFAELTLPGTIHVGADGTTGLGYCTTELV
ncbi:MAG: type III-B CRISPR module RAMP protein Cmr4 [Limisphaerales bacterium]